MPQSDQYIMRFPFINTLVYLTNEGAPTVRCVSTTFSPSHYNHRFEPEIFRSTDLLILTVSGF
jgi:hypothetical protein